MESTRRQIIVGYAVFTLLFLAGVFVFTLFRIDLLSMLNEKKAGEALKDLRYQLEVNFSLKGKFEEPELSAMFDRALSAEPRLLVVAALTDEGIIRAKGVAKEYVVNADLGPSLRSLEYKKPMGTAVRETELILKFKDERLPGRTRLNALYISFSKSDSVTLLEEILYILLGFFGLTLVAIIISSLIFRREAKNLARALAPDAELDLPPPPVRPADRAPAPVAGDDGAGQSLEWSEDEREARRRERFSETTGLVRREFFQERLGQEIERSVSFGEDLSLFLLSAEGSDGAAWKVRLVPVLHRMFGGDDLAHEFGPGTAAVVAPGMDIDTAVKTGRLLYQKAAEQKMKVRLGIASRNGRTLTPAVFAEEASRALAQAGREGQSPIVAFRSDPAKFNEYMRRS